jgi:hypothetical protein
MKKMIKKIVIINEEQNWKPNKIKSNSQEKKIMKMIKKNSNQKNKD